MSTPALRETHAVSAKLIAGEEADAIANVACADNDGVVVEDHGSYITLSGTGNIELRIDSIEEELGPSLRRAYPAGRASQLYRAGRRRG